MIELYVSHGPNNEPMLRWDKVNVGDYKYRLFRRIVEQGKSSTYQSVSTFDLLDADMIYKNINVLNLHIGSENAITYTDIVGNIHTISESAILEKILLEPTTDAPFGYGLGRVNIHSRTIDEFNSNHKSILFTSSEYVNYDVICIGFDIGDISDNKFNFTNDSLDSIKQAIEFGTGVLVTNNFISSKIGADNGLGPLRDCFLVKVGENTNDITYIPDYDFEVSFEDTRAYINKKGSITSYPWDIGNFEDTFDIKKTSSNSQFNFSETWIKFSSPLITGINNLTPELMSAGNFYLSTNNNCAMIQISNALDIKDIEKKIISNTIYYLSQVTQSNYFTDVTQFEDKPPMVPTITNQYIDLSDNSLHLEYFSMDRGVICEYYVEGNSPYGNSLLRSNVVSFEYISEIECFMYKFIPIDKEFVDVEWVETTEMTLSLTNLSHGRYKLLLKCRDFCGNESAATELLAFIPNNQDALKQKYIHNPNMHRLNHRYRGPHESYKVKSEKLQIKLNIQKLQELTSSISQKSDKMSNNNFIDNGEMLILKNHIKNQIKYIKSEKFYIACEQNNKSSW